MQYEDKSQPWCTVQYLKLVGLDLQCLVDVWKGLLCAMQRQLAQTAVVVGLQQESRGREGGGREREGREGREREGREGGWRGGRDGGKVSI